MCVRNIAIHDFMLSVNMYHFPKYTLDDTAVKAYELYVRSGLKSLLFIVID